MSIKPRKLKNGRTVYDVTISYGNRREYKTYPTRKEAEAAQDDAKRYKRALRDKTGKIRLGEYIDKIYLPIASRRLQVTSLETYETTIKNAIKPSLGSYYIEDIDRLAIQTMVDDCATESVAKKAVATLKTILNEAIGDGYISGNPANARYAYPPKGTPRDNGAILSDFEQIAQFIAVVQNTASEGIVRLVMTGLMLGLRPEERYALDYEDFDFDNGTVTVENAYVSARSRHGGNQLKATKTPLSRRVIPMPQPFADWFAEQGGGQGAWIVGETGERLSPSTAQKAWRRYLNDHPELPPVTLENMRHSFATSCLHAGMHVEDLSRMLGHSNINTTFDRYIRPDLANIRAGLAQIPYPESGYSGVSPGQTHGNRSSILRASTKKRPPELGK